MSDNFDTPDLDKLLQGLNFEGGQSSGSSDVGNIDTIKEIYNVAFDAAANTFSEVLNHKVNIFNPSILEFDNISEFLNLQEDSTIVEMKFFEGLINSQIFVIKNIDLAIIADIMMGGSGKVDSSVLSDLQISATQEVFNQVTDTIAESLGGVFNKGVSAGVIKYESITPDTVQSLDLTIQNTPITGVVYSFVIGNVLDSELIQLMPSSAANEQIQMFLGSVDSMMQGMAGKSSKTSSGGSRMFGSSTDDNSSGNFGIPDMGDQPITIQPAKFASFDGFSPQHGLENQNLDLVLDVGLKLTVELGRAELPIKKVLELTRGSVIELDKIAGEPVDLLANGKLIAKGEVVVIEDNFGLRITNIISPADRLKNL